MLNLTHAHPITYKTNIQSSLWLLGCQTNTDLGGELQEDDFTSVIPQIPEEMSRGRNSYTEQDLRPLSLEELRGSSSNTEPSDYHCYLQDCVDDLLKEMKEKFKGWVSCSTSEQADLAYKKVCTLSLTPQPWVLAHL